ncbi:MAG TPA: SDR family NAD(P)-dependent oxidoreductase [Longimicrobiales bacterium]|nr:SDR family NAD(P)-dependent oxidoreductase [Longimicrobiales bacterium]
MNRIQGKLALVTGASAGIGEACARRFAVEGADLELWARRAERLESLAEELGREHGVTVRVRQVDVRDRETVRAAAAKLLEESGPPDILVNNAGLAAGLEPLHAGAFDDWDRMIDTNVKGLLNVTRLLLPAMIDAGRGHVINIGSTAGHMVYPGGNVYNATKFAVKALTDAINVDLAGTPLRVSSVDPGAVETEFSTVRFHGDESRASKVYSGYQPLSGDDVADAVAYIANLPPHVNALRIVLMPTAQRNAYVVHRDQEGQR